MASTWTNSPFQQKNTLYYECDNLDNERVLCGFRNCLMVTGISLLQNVNILVNCVFAQRDTLLKKHADAIRTNTQKDDPTEDTFAVIISLARGKKKDNTRQEEKSTKFRYINKIN